MLQIDPYMMSKVKIEEKIASELNKFYISEKEAQERETNYCNVNYISQNIKDSFT